MNPVRFLLISLALSGCPAAMSAQTLVSPLTLPQYQFFNAVGQPLASGYVYTCVAGSSCGPGGFTPQNTYTDSTGQTSNSNPIQLNSAGEASIWWISSSAYKIVVTDSAGTVQWTQDNVKNGNINTTPQSADYILSTASAYGASPSNSDNIPAFNAAMAAAVSSGLGRVLIPQGDYCILSQLQIPNKVRVFGVGFGDGVVNTTIQACPGFNGSATFPNNMMVALVGTVGESLTDVNLDCHHISGCGLMYNGSAQEESWYQRIVGGGFSSYGLWDQSQNAGPYDELYLGCGADCTPNTVNFVFGGSESREVLENSTFDNNGYTTGNQPLRAMVIAGEGLAIRDVHVEHSGEALTIGNPFSTHFVNNFDSAVNVQVDNLVCTVDCPLAIHVINSGFANGNKNYTFRNVISGGSINVQDDTFTPSVTCYGVEYSVQNYPSTKKNLKCNDGVTPYQMYNPQDFFGAVNIEPGNYLGFLSSPTGSPVMKAFYDSGSNIDVFSAAAASGPTGLLFQDTSVTPGRNGGGLFVWMNGYTHSPTWGGIGTGLITDGGTYTATGAYAADIDMKDGTHQFFCDTGLTAGSPYTPTGCLTVSKTEVVAPNPITTSNTDQAGVLTFTSSGSSNTYTFNGNYATPPRCVITGQFANSLVYAQVGGTCNGLSGPCTLTGHTTVNVTGIADYICFPPPL